MQNLNIPNANFGIVHNLLSEQHIAKLMPKLHSLDWQSFSRFPRTNVAFGKGYTYSGVTHPATEIPQFLKDISVIASNAIGFPQDYWDSVLLNKYANGKDSIGFHQDNEPELGYNPRVIALSLGAERTFVLMDKVTRKEYPIILPHNSLIVMENNSQIKYLHGIPKDSSCYQERISITFRHHK